MGQWLCNDKMVDHDFGGCILKFLLGMSMIFILILYPIYWLFFKKTKTNCKNTSSNQANHIEITGISYGHLFDDKYIKFTLKKKQTCRKQK